MSTSSELRLNLRIGVNADGTVQVLGATRDGINGISNASGNASRSLRSMDSAAASVMRTLAPMIGIYELISFGDKVVKDTATVQDLDTRLHSLTAVAGDYAKTVDYISTVAEDQHKKLNDLSDGYARLRTLQNSGIITGQQTQGMFEGLNNAGSALGAGNDQLKQTFFGLAQGLASGILHAEELNQVTEPLPGLLQSLDKAAGLSAGGFRKLTVDGKVTSQMFAETLVKALHDFDGAAAATAKNVNAKSTDISNSWTRLVTSFEPSTSAIFTPLQDGVKDVLDSTRQFNEAAITVGETNVSASSLAQGAWAVTTNAISNGWDILKTAGLGAAIDTASSWIVSGDQMQSNVKFLVNDMIGLFVGLGHSVGIIFGALAINVGNTLDNAIARASAAAGDVARMGAGDFSFSASRAVVDKPMVDGWTDAAAQLKIDLSTDYIGTFTEAVKGASVAYQGLADEQKKAAAEAEQAKAKSLQLAGAHNAVGSAAGLSAEATKKAAAEAKKHADAIAKEIESLNDQHLKLSLTERDYELSKLAALGMSDAVKASSIAVWDSNKALEAQKAGIEAGVSSMDAEIERYNKLTQSVNEYKYSQLLLAGVSPGDAVEIVAQSSVNDGIDKQQQSIKDAWSSLESYNKSLDDAHTKTVGLQSVTSAVFDGALGGVNLLAGGFDNLIKSIESTTVEQQKLNVERAKLDAVQPDASKGFTDEYIKQVKTKAAAEDKYSKDVLKLNDQIISEKVTGARQITGAVSSMLKQGSTEQREVHAISMALAGVELAMNVMKITGIGAVAVAETASIAPSVAASTAKGTAKAAEAVATQASAGPYIGFALMAAMAVAMAAIGFGVGGAASVSPGPQGLSPDTGTVLGDSSAKSQSIDNTYQLLQDIQADNYPVLKSIDQGIADLHSGITDVITRLFQAGGLATVNAPASAYKPGMGVIGSSTQAALQFANLPTSLLGMKIDPISNFLMNGIFGGKQTSTVTAQGLATSPTSIMDIVAGQNLRAQQFAQIETKTDGGWFGKDKFSFTTQYAALDAATQKALNDVFKSMGSTMMGLADNLGMGLSDRVENYIIPALNVDLKGLDGEAAAKKLNGVVSSALDTMSTAVFSDILGQYQQLGEGLFETAVRVVSEVAVVKDSLAKSGLSITGDAIAISDGLAQAAGGLQEFQKQFDTYYQKFYTDAERQAFTQKQLASQLSDLNLILPASRDGYRQLIEALNINNAADQQRYSLLLKLSGAADDYYNGLESSAEAALHIANQQRALDIQLMELSGNAIGALTAKRKDELAAMDETLRFSQQAVWALSAANKAVDDAMNVLKKSVSDQKALNNTAYQASIAANNLQKASANDLLSSLKTVAANLKSALSSTVVESDAFTRQRRLSAQSVLASALSSAKAGGSLANYAGLDQALIDIAKPSEQLYTSFIDFARDQGRTGNVISGLADYTAAQVSVAEQTLNAVEANNQLLTDAFNTENARLDDLITRSQSQIDAINGTTAVVMTVADAVSNLSAVINAKMTIERAITTAKAAEKGEFDARSVYDAAAAQAVKSQQNVAAAIDAANKASAAANAAQSAAQAPIAPAPNTYQNGLSGNAIWEQILGDFNAQHTARFGVPMNRSWNADADAQNAYRTLVGYYNDTAAQARAAAQATAAGLANVANAAAALIPGYQSTAAVDQAAADQAAAAYSTAASYAVAARAAVPNIQGFAVGINEVPYDMFAQIHQGERILPAADNRELMMRLSAPAPSNTNDVAAEIRALQETVRQLKSELEKITKNTGGTESHTRDTATVLKKCTLGGDKVRTTVV
ncbi:MAG: tape measure protein [Methylobacter sp.]|uniref:tape measure protein n=1 Tax=Methylobacter sp. TaxID=2051955 RepID=UPI002731087B|nr:tape measure protein [Methylobacter sp.]MDP1664139.1 tape measure protein [Methylobacter sp.]